MNKEKLLRLADALEKFEAPVGVDGFHMGYWCDANVSSFRSPTDDFGDCKSAACMAGWAVALEGHDLSRLAYGSSDRIADVAVNVLDLDPIDAYSLFQPSGRSEQEITPALAAKTIRHFVETGNVDWWIDE